MLSSGMVFRTVSDVRCLLARHFVWCEVDRGLCSYDGDCELVEFCQRIIRFFEGITPVDALKWP